MLRKLISLGLAAVMAISCTAGIANAQISDIPPSHWSYEMVQELAEKGLILGYPDGKFMGERALTRYEMAAIVHRAMRMIEQMSGKEMPTMTTDSNKMPEVTESDLAAVKSLVEEYKTELAVMGADLKAVQDDLAAVKTDVDFMKEGYDTIYETVTNPEGPLLATEAAVRKMNKLKLSGYVQARYTDGEYYPTSGVSSASNDLAKESQFLIRRARLKADANFGKFTGMTLQVDAGGSNRERSVELRDAYVEYYHRGVKEIGPIVTFGQQKWPFGFQVVQSSGDRETPERADVLRALFPGERDRGVKVGSGTDTPLQWSVGLFNGVGIEQGGNAGSATANANPWYSTSMSDNNNYKDVAARVAYYFNDNLQAGVSGYWGKAGGVTMTSRAVGNPSFYVPLTKKERWGVDLQYTANFAPLTIRAEYVEGKEPYISPSATAGTDATALDVDGGYVQGLYSLSPYYTLVYMYDWFDDGLASGAHGERKTQQIGLIKWLDDTSRLKVFYQMRDEDRNEYDNDGWTVEWITKF